MNIFITDECPAKSAQSLPNVLVNKMIVESCQLLSTAHIILDNKQVAMKSTHANHPCSVWARANTDNYLWLFNHFVALLSEYNFRTGKIHKSEEHVPSLIIPPRGLSTGLGLRDFKFCGPDQYLIEAKFNVTQAYRNYLKNKFIEWQTRCDKRPVKVEYTNRIKPIWLLEK